MIIATKPFTIKRIEGLPQLYWYQIQVSWTELRNQTTTSLYNNIEIGL